MTGIGNNSKDETILKTIVSLIKDLGLKPVAEGVERKQQVEFLSNEGCYIIQGFLLLQAIFRTLTEKLLKGFTRLSGRSILTGKSAPDVRDSDINRYLDSSGIKHSLIGYKYLFTAIRLGCESPRHLKKIYDIYSTTAQIYETQINCVERGIRFAISHLGLTNKEFILKAIDDLHYVYSLSQQNNFEAGSIKAAAP